MVWNRATIAESQWSQRCLGDVRNTLHNQECLHGVSGCSHRWSKYFHQTRAQIKASLLRPACFQNKKGFIGVIFLMYLLVGSPCFFFFTPFLFFPTVVDRERKEWPTVIFLFVLHVCGVIQDTWHVCTEIPTSPEAKFNWFKSHTKNCRRPELPCKLNIWFGTKVEESVGQSRGEQPLHPSC